MAFGSTTASAAQGQYLPRTREFRRARRHSRLVGLLRMALPMFGAVLIAAMILIAEFTPEKQFDFSVAKTTIGPNGITMENPKIMGSDASGRGYRISASRAFQSLLSPDEIQLNDIIADIQFPNRSGITVSAGRGDFNNANSILILRGGIVASSQDGYAFRLDSAQMNLETKELTSGSNPSIQHEDSTTVAEHLTVDEDRETIVLEGNVRSIFMPPNREQRHQQ